MGAPYNDTYHPRSYLKNASNAQGLCCPANIGGISLLFL